ncbi:tripartite tricarboxylate transporter TctB family protein [Aliamphritea spongicola]|uniref:tripartite tricarboxylate transporter TctB family protein n=1 Tax=Aliamphritea spongicola TaxID=707589 RepID=UPI00196B2B5D|nr:tripartite tricarboxylate transporter TctB family protein [Aliamphritea spongicola]MBN3564335.1 tripartite tricarboxylate transporter TctB family protein [Aliamphritea spongicola]
MAIRNICEALVLALLSAVAVWGALQVPDASPGETWAGIVPFGAAVALGVIAAISLLDALRSHRADTAGQSNQGARDVIILFIIAVLYQQSFSWFGYLLPTAIVAPVALYMFGVRSPLGLALSVILCPLAFHIIFFMLLGVYPPYGEVFDLNEFIQG